MKKRTNILLITSDQQHYSALGAVNGVLRTPGLDRLCAEGTRFDRAYCANPVCTPSRASMITGMYPSWHGAWTIGVKLPEDVPTVGDRLREGGYGTTLIGKAHFQPLRSEAGSESLESQPVMRDLDFWRGFHGPFYGFEHVELGRMHADESHVGQHYALWMEEKGLKDWRKYFRAWPEVNDDVRRHHWDLPEEFHYSVWTAERAMAAMRRHVEEEDRPFFLWASFHDPHPPYLVPGPWDSMYEPGEVPVPEVAEGDFEGMARHFGMTREERPNFEAYRETFGSIGFHSHRIKEEALRKNIAVYYGMVSLMDREIGRILGEVDRLGIAEETLIVFTSDHGHFLGQHGLIDKGAFHYEDLVRVPMVVRWPGKVGAGKVSGAMQSLVDFSPTFLRAAGLEVPGAMQGVSQLGVWQGREEAARREVIVENRHQPTRVHLRTYVDERYKLTVYREGEDGELFDLVEDPGENRNLWGRKECAGLKGELMLRFLQAEMRREPTRMRRVWGA